MSWLIPKTSIKIGATDVSLFFGLPILAYSEIKFGTEVLGLPHGVVFGVALSLAYFVPGFLDVYVITAMRRGGQEVGWALGLVITSVTGGSIAHLYELTTEAKVLASAAFGVVLAVVIWRVKTIAHADSPDVAAAKKAAAQLVEANANLARVRADVAERDRQLAAAADTARLTAAEHTAALQAVTDKVAGLERELTDTEHRHEVALVRMRGQLDVARSTARSTTGGNVLPLHKQEQREAEAPETAAATDEEILKILAPMVKANPGTGRPAALEAIRAAGLACGSQRVRELLTVAKADNQITQAGADDEDGDDFGGEVAVSS